MNDQFTALFRKVMQLANQEAQRLNHEYIGTEHVLLGLMKEGSCTAVRILASLDIDLQRIRNEVEYIVHSGPDIITMGKLPQTPRAKKVIEYAMEEARNLNHNYVGTEHLLLGLLREQEGVAAQVLMNLGLKLEKVHAKVTEIVKNSHVCMGEPDTEMDVSKEIVSDLAEGEISSNKEQADPDDRIRKLSTTITELHLRIMNLHDALVGAWVDYDHNPYEMGTPEYEAVTIGHVNATTSDGTHTVNLVHQMDQMAVVAIATKPGGIGDANH